MIRVVLLVDAERDRELAGELADEDILISQRAEPGEVPPLEPGHADALLVSAGRATLTAALVDACDRAGIPILVLGESRLTARYRLASVPAGATAARIASELATVTRTVSTSPVEARPSRLIAVWGPHGAPGRSTVAIQLAAELARTGSRTALIDADTVAPSIALLLGLGDEAPGIAAACRRSELGGLDAAELDRIAVPVETGGGTVDVLAGLNRPSRWLELSAPRLATTLAACKEWSERVVVDVAAAFDEDEEITWDLEGPRRHAATTAVLRVADEVVAVASADPLGIARFLRDHSELRGLIGATPVRVVVNRVRPGPLGIDARGQIRRTLARFAGIDDVAFLPYDLRAADAGLLHARAIADITPRSALAGGIRRLVSGMGPDAIADSLRGSSRSVRWPRRARAAREVSRPGSDPVSAS